MRRVPIGRVPMRRVPNRRGYIVMADTFTWFIFLLLYYRRKQAYMYAKIRTGSAENCLPECLINHQVNISDLTM